MSFPLAYAEAADAGGSNLVLVLVCVGAVAVVTLLAVLLAGLASARRHRHRDTIVAAAVLWGFLAAVSLVNASLAQFKGSKERAMRIQSGYYDPQDVSDAPALPWPAWGALGAGYGVLAVWSWAGANSRGGSRPGQL